MAVRKYMFLFGLWLSFIWLLPSPAVSQTGYYFGQNKVQYKNFKWAVFRTRHFDVHYYAEEKQAAEDAARMAERGYDYLSDVLNHQIKERIPIILYSSINDFQQTNAVSGMISDGTRGVTESLKKRVILPLTGSYREFNHVLVHEMVHAFQYDIIFGKNTQKANVNNIPLWFVEGMAEYLSNGMDNTTRMWVRDGLLNNNLISVKKLNSVYDIRVYRLGQALWYYIGETYGKQKVGEIFKSGVRAENLDMVFKKHLGMDMKELTKAWHEYSWKLVMPTDSTLQDPPQIAEQLTHQESYFHRINITPAVSPDGNHIAYIGNKNFNDEIYLLSREEDGSWKHTSLLKGGSGKQYEALRYFESGINWSRDGGKIAFVSKSGRDDAIYVMDPYKQKVIKKFVFKEFNGLLSPTFSPQGNRLAFVGISGGISDLYIFDVKTDSLERLTNDRFAVLQPQWSPNGESIVFVSDRGAGSDVQNLLFGNYDLALYHFGSGEIETITNLNGNVTNPQWSPDGSEIAFISDHQGIPNIYRLRLGDGQITRMTALKNGVSGITETTPAFSWSADGRVMAFSSFYKNSWQIYWMEVDLNAPATPALAAVDIQPVSSPPLAKEPVKYIAMNGDPVANTGETIAAAAETPGEKLWLPALPDPNTIYDDYQLADTVESRKYSKKFKLDAVALGGGYSTFFGVEGGAQFLFSDMLGDQNLFVSTGLRFNSILHSDAAVTYFNQARRINYGLQAFQLNNQYLVFGTFNSLGSIRDTYRGFNGLISYPFDRFNRVELSGGLTWVERDLLLETYTPGGINREASGIAVYNYAQVGAAYIYDNTIYGFMGPVGGSRYRLSVETTAKDFQFTNISLDYRRYFKVNSRSFLAWRFLGLTSVGKDKQIYSIGGPYSFRGADYDAMVGTKFFFSNLEYRFPLLPFLPPSLDMFSGATFLDLAGAWGVNIPGLSKNNFQPFTTKGGFRLQDMRAAVGVGARFNIGYFVLQYNYAWPTDGQKFGQPIGLFSIGTFF